MYKLRDELQESYLLFLFGSLVINARKLFKDVSLEKERKKERKKRIQRESKIKFRANPRFKKPKCGTFFPITWST